MIEIAKGAEQITGEVSRVQEDANGVVEVKEFESETEEEIES